MAKQRVENRRAVGVDLSGSNFGSVEYFNCFFTEANGRNAHMEDATFVHCDFTNFDVRRGVFRLSCLAGSGNTIDAVTAASFLYWFNHFFALPPEIKSQIEPIIAPYKRRLTLLFSAEI